MGLGVLVLDPSGGGGDGDDVKNNGEEYEQGQDPPAARVGDPTAEHGRSLCGAAAAGGNGAGRRWRLKRGVVRSGFIETLRETLSPVE